MELYTYTSPPRIAIDRRLHTSPYSRMGQPVLVLYGTQTGNSRSIAQEVVEKATARGITANISGMEDFKKIDFDATPVLITIVSSTGNGDPPESAERFWRLIKKRTTPQMFEKTQFAVCAMGDSNYEQFCETGKQFDKHYERLGGTRFLKRCDVDEVDGIEVHVEPW